MSLPNPDSVVTEQRLSEFYASILPYLGGMPNDASDIDYDNTNSGLTADDAQEAIDEVVEDVTDKANLKLASSGTTASGEIRFGVDGNGNYGYIKAGADSVTPFKNPTGNKAIPQITQNGTVTDIAVADYATVSLEVAVPQPSGTKNISITQNGTTTEDVTNYTNVKVTVNVPDAYLQKIRKTWSGFRGIYGDQIWSDGDNIYYSKGTTHYVLDKSTSTWMAKIWSGLTNFDGYYVWSDGDNIYYSKGTNQYVLDKATSTWTAKTWSGLTSFNGTDTWSDGDNIYYSRDYTHYVLDKSTSTWTAKTWNGLTNFNGNCIWTDGDLYYFSYSSGSSSNQYVLDKATSTWTAKTWSGLTNFIGNCIWTDGNNIYYSSATNQYVLDKATSTWTAKTWSGLTDFPGYRIWTDGNLYYYSYAAGYQYALDKIVTGNTWYQKNLT